MPVIRTSPSQAHWDVETNNKQLLEKIMQSKSNNTTNESDDIPTVMTRLTANIPVTHNFRRDLLSFYKTLQLVPHPQLVPFHLDDEDSSSTDAPIVYDLAEIHAITLKNWQLDDGSLHGLGFVLPRCPSIHSLTLFNVQLSSRQIETLIHWIPNTQIAHFTLDWNTSSHSSNKADSTLPGPEIFGMLLSSKSPITNLSLRSTGLLAEHAIGIAKALRTNSKLQSLNLFRNENIGDEGVMAIAYALPFNTTLKSLSLANTSLSGHTAKLLIDVLTTYTAPPSLLREIQEAEPRIQAELDAAKKAKKKVDRSVIIASLGLPVLETIDGVQYAPGNSVLEDLVLSGNTAIEESDLLAMNTVLEHHHSKLVHHLRQIKLQRIPGLHQCSTTVVSPQSQILPSNGIQLTKLSEFLHF